MKYHNKKTLSDANRKAFEEIIVNKGGVPASLRAEFWNLCTGIDHVFKSGHYMSFNYYHTLCLKMQKTNSSLMMMNNPMIFHHDGHGRRRLRDELDSLSSGSRAAGGASKAAIGRIVEAYAVWRNPAVGY